eukprot:CAMPEP_0179989182 /NCGR_PEP_ID=MMETSP0984-20121128/3749_1 /TAXON_ID=483367 /ORGANISM="non described non described, Strain CCMP 2436" /LENGTH=37 /DNA_ID= /DNA_START= /DNA_END= /DNA_ORIENTATION=
MAAYLSAACATSYEKARRKRICRTLATTSTSIGCALR